MVSHKERNGAMNKVIPADLGSENHKDSLLNLRCFVVLSKTKEKNVHSKRIRRKFQQTCWKGLLQIFVKPSETTCLTEMALNFIFQ